MIGNGNTRLEISSFGSMLVYRVFGGPYRDCPSGWHGVCLLETVPVEKDAYVHLPIRDFSIPEDKAQVRVALKETYRALLDGQDVYVGCMGGWGRTGLFLSLLAKVVGVRDPVSYVRLHYGLHAVETRAQEAYVEDFSVVTTRLWLFWQLLKMKVRPYRGRSGRKIV